VSLGGHRLKEMDRRLSGWRLVEESDHQGQIDVKPQHVVRVNSPSAPNPATPLKTVTPFTTCRSCKVERISRIKVLRRP
jgi:hypothetical protein